MTLAERQALIACIDLTSLNTEDNNDVIISLCHKALTPLGAVAAVCVYPQFVSLAWQKLIATPIKIVTVANFPSGDQPSDKVFRVIVQAILDGASEIDVVMPYRHYQADQPQRLAVRDFIAHCKMLCGTQAILKVILETGVLTDSEIQQASEDAILSGADFLKTSTGKTPIGATLSAAKIMLTVITQTDRPVGLKISGGVQQLAQAAGYVSLVKHYLGEHALKPSQFRIGASRLLDALLETPLASQ